MNTEEAIAKRGLKSIGTALRDWIFVFKLDMFQICISSQGGGGGVTGKTTGVWMPLNEPIKIRMFQLLTDSIALKLKHSLDSSIKTFISKVTKHK